MISLSHEFLFVHVPKTAGNAIQNVLKRYSEDTIVCLAPHQDGVERFEVRSERFDIHKHSTLAEYRAQIGDRIFDRLFKFAGVRNPWDRLISYYFSPHRGPQPWDRDQFVALLDEVRPVGDYLFLPGRNDSVREVWGNLDGLIRYERLDDDFRAVCKLIGIPWQPLPVRNRSSRSGYADYYDDELIELVRLRFSAEIEAFGYTFDGSR